LSRTVFHVSTNAGSLKGIGRVYDGRLFSSRIPSRHKGKHINWKEIFAVLHILVLWYKEWAYGSLDIACDNAAVVVGINKRSIPGPAIHPLHIILLICMVFDIEIKAHWVSTEENVIADAALRHDFKRLIDLGFKDQVDILRPHASAPIQMSTLCQQLMNYFTTHSPRPHTKPTNQFEDRMNHSAAEDITQPSQLQSSPLLTGSLPLLHQYGLQCSKATHPYCGPITHAMASISAFLMTHVSISASRV